MKLRRILILLVLLSATLKAQDTCKIMAYNLLNYVASDTAVRNPYFRRTIGATSPDVLVVEEMTSQTMMTAFLNNVLNRAGAGTYQAGTFIDGPDTDNGIFFKSNKFAFISNTPIRTDLRDISQFKIVHLATLDTLYLYAVHLKASSGSTNEQGRALEVDSLRRVTNLLTPGSNFMVMGDFNIYGSTEPAYTKLLAVNGTTGYFLDMFNLTGTWNNGAYSIYHTQSTRTRAFGGGSTGGMDDRFDMILFSQAINDPGGITYIPQSMKAYGNDGQHYNDSINKQPNTAVPPDVADALHYSSDHLPIMALFKFEPPTGIIPISTVPSAFSLSQNYPNPFNPTTKIKFSIPETGNSRNIPVRLVVYDVLGRVIAELFNGTLAPGSYEYEWNALSAPAGVYFCRLQSGGQSDAKKMILAK